MLQMYHLATAANGFDKRQTNTKGACRSDSPFYYLAANFLIVYLYLAICWKKAGCRGFV